MDTQTEIDLLLGVTVKPFFWDMLFLSHAITRYVLPCLVLLTWVHKTVALYGLFCCPFLATDKYVLPEQLTTDTKVDQ